MNPKVRRWLGLVVISLGVAMIVVDGTIINVAIPAIIADIGLTSTGTQWVQEIYTLVFAALLLVFGRLADRFGRRRIFALGVVVFVVSSVIAAQSDTEGTLIAARAVQGVGGAMMLPSSLSLLNAGFRGRDRAIAFGVWGATIGGMAAVGPLLGGWLTTAYTWRWAFGINVPIGLVILIGLLLLVTESRDHESRSGSDVFGALLSAIGFGGVVFGLIEGRSYGWWRVSDEPFRIGTWSWPFELSIVPVAFAAGLAALAAFLAVQVQRNRAGKVAMLDLSLFRIASFRNGNIAAAIVSLGEFGLIFGLPLWLQNVAGYTAFQTGLVLLGLAGGSFLASGMVAPLSKLIAPVGVVRVGIGLEILGVLGIGVLLRPGSGWELLVPLLFVYGVGVGFATAQLTGVILAEVPIERSGQGSGTQSTSRQLGSAFGIAILGTVLFSLLGSQLSAALSADGIPDAQRDQLVAVVRNSAGGAIAGLAKDPRTAPVAQRARESFTTATRASAVTAAGFLGVGLLASLSLGTGKTGVRRPARQKLPSGAGGRPQ